MRAEGLFHELQDSKPILYPDATVIAGFTDPEAAEQVLFALKEQFGRLNVSVLFGPEGLRVLGSDSNRDGAGVAPVVHAVADPDHLRQETATLRRGGFLITVTVSDEAQKVRAVETLRGHAALHVAYFGRAAIERL